MSTSVLKRFKAVIGLVRSMSASLEGQNELLQEQNRLLNERLAEQSALLNSQLESLQEQNGLVSQQVERLKSLTWHTSQAREIQESIRTNLTVPILNSMQEFFQNRQLGLLETLDVIRSERINLARFGDGELSLMLRLDASIKFQENSPSLMGDLKQVLNSAIDHPDKLLIGMPYIYRDNRHWGNIYTQYWRLVRPMVEPIARFANSQISRPLMFSAHGQEAVAAWRSLWEGLDITIVTGQGSRFDMLPDLFDNVRHFKFEYSLPNNAHADVPRLVQTLKDDESELVLISLGPAGTILASELAKIGKWALDIGHVSNSYEFQLKGGNFPERRPVSNSA